MEHRFCNRVGVPPTPPPQKKTPKNIWKFFAKPVCMHSQQCKCLPSYGTKGTLNPHSTHLNNEPVPQVLKQVVNLSCYNYGMFSQKYVQSGGTIIPSYSSTIKIENFSIFQSLYLPFSMKRVDNDLSETNLKS